MAVSGAGGDIPGEAATEAADKEECLRRCVEEPRCSATVFNYNLNTCDILQVSEEARAVQEAGYFVMRKCSPGTETRAPLHDTVA